MKKNPIILDALHNALTLLSEEYETVLNTELKGQYKQAIDKIENAIKMINNKKQGKTKSFQFILFSYNKNTFRDDLNKKDE